jgi:hypothetical protein
MKKFTIILSLIFLVCMSLLLINKDSNESVAKKNEKFYQTQMCDNFNGEMEFTLPDKTRVDCLTDEFAIEVDWAKKWAQGVGQSIYYAEITNKRPAIALIMDNTKADERHLKRLIVVAEKLNIHIIRLNK